MDIQIEKPRWLRDLLRFLPLKSQFVLSGNVRDHYPLEISPGVVATQPLLPFVGAELRRAGVQHVIAYDSVQGFRGLPPLGRDAKLEAELLRGYGLAVSPEGRAAAGLDLFAETLGRIVADNREPVALVADFASRLLVRPDAPSAAEHGAFTRALVLAHDVRPRPFGTPPRPFFNPVLWVVDKEGDLPDWFLVGNPRIRHIPVPKPDHIARRQVASSLIRTVDGFAGATPAAIDEAVRGFVDGTEGLLVIDLVAITQLCHTEALGLERVGEAIRRYKVGVTEDPWMRIERNKIRDAAAFVRRRVKGQEHAVVHILDIIKRAVTGVGSPRRGSRPRGIAFLAGPTGVGKTELAKTVTSLLFGDESAYIRFDMSEFSAEHSDQRLIGAPPGYIGYDVGGELTNAVREKPFSVVLFDEIEKAHPRILDKFLQILDDGVLTSGRGDRVYFSETFIIFTSNLGIYRFDRGGTRVPNVTLEEPLAAVELKVREEIERHFKLTLGRPEILNRIGENIIVFDFIRGGVADEIFAQMVENTISDIATLQGVGLTLKPAVLEVLRARCLSDLSNGGRGIRNKLEAHFVNPLARALFDVEARPGAVFTVDSVNVTPVTTFSLVPTG
jgi:hypothetical protein